MLDLSHKILQLSGNLKCNSFLYDIGTDDICYNISSHVLELIS